MPSWTVVKVSVRVALILMVCSLFLCREVGSAEGMRRVALGLPLPFVTLDASGRAGEAYPRCVRLGDPRFEPVRLLPSAALADLLLLTVVLVMGERVVRLGRARRRDGTE